ncbi:MAG: hypothetical protein COA44_00420 [Arcobacter sp.]|nr:MAG: hypothetical protein COA44_00420 [Arcobacter sp.]
MLKNIILKTKEQFTQVNIHLWLNHLFIVYMFFLPISRKARVSTFVIILALFLIRGDVLSHIKEGLKNKIILAFSLYGLLHIIWFAGIGFENYKYAMSLVKSSLYYFYPIVFISFINPKYISRALTAFFFGVLYSELYSYGLALGFIPIEYSYYKDINDPTPFFHHIHYGLLLALSLTFLFYNFFTLHLSKLQKILISIFFFSASINLFITGGRIGYLLFIILLFIASIRLIKKKVYLYIGVLSLFISIILFSAYQFSNVFHKRINETVHTIELLSNFQTSDKFYQTSFGNRIALWELSYYSIKENLLFGSGTGQQMIQIREKSVEKNKNKNIANHIGHTHSEYISLLLQFGLIGFFFYLNIFYQIINYKETNHHKKSFLIFIAIAIFIFGFIELVTLKEHLSLVLFTTLTTLFLVRQESQIPSAKTYKINLLIYPILITFIYIISHL